MGSVSYIRIQDNHQEAQIIPHQMSTRSDNLKRYCSLDQLRKNPYLGENFAAKFYPIIGP